MPDPGCHVEASGWVSVPAWYDDPVRVPLRLVVPLALLLVACSGSSNSGTANGGCTQTLAKACATKLQPGQFGISCIDTWDQVQTDLRYCSLPADEYSADCGAYRALLVVGAHSDFAYYYDKTSGALVAVVYGGSTYSGPQCVGGPADFKRPSNCPTFKAFITCP